MRAARATAPRPDLEPGGVRPRRRRIRSGGSGPGAATDRRGHGAGDDLCQGPCPARRDPVARACCSSARGGRSCGASGVECRLRHRRGDLHAGAAGRRGLRLRSGPRWTYSAPTSPGRALAVAATGRYRERAVRALEHGPAPDGTWTSRPDGSYVVGAGLRRLVQVPPPQPCPRPVATAGEAGFDLIICRNVLIYFEAPTVERVIAPGAVVAAGRQLLMLGAADALQRPHRCGPPPRDSRDRSAGQATGGRCAARPPRSAASRRLPRDQRLTGGARRGGQGRPRRRPGPRGVAARRHPARCRRALRARARRARSWPPGPCGCRASAVRCTPTPGLPSRRSRSAAPMTRSATGRPRGVLTSRPCGRSIRPTAGTSGSSSRFTSATSPPHAARGWTVMKTPDRGAP